VRSRVAATSAVVLLVVSGCSFGDDEVEDAAVDADFVVELVRLGSERTEGTVGLSEEPAGKTRVEILLSEPSTGRRAEIRGGNCDVRAVGARTACLRWSKAGRSASLTCR
jgi:hypothetical protein